MVDDAGFAADGGCDVVVINGPASHLELMWEEPRTAHTFRQMARYGRLIMHHRRGTGLSDPASEPPALEQQVADLRAVLAAVTVSGWRSSDARTSVSRRCSPPPTPSR